MVLTELVVRVSEPVAVAALALSVGCTQAAHDVGCAEFLDMSGEEKDQNPDLIPGL